MRISDWSSDVCSSDLQRRPVLLDLARGGGEEFLESRLGGVHRLGGNTRFEHRLGLARQALRVGRLGQLIIIALAVQRFRRDRKSVVSGKRWSVRVDLGVRRTIKKKKTTIIKYK